MIQMDSDSSGSEYEAEALQCWRMWETKVHGAIEALGLDTLTTSEDMRRAEMILIRDSTDSTEREQRPQFMPWCLPLNMEEPIMSAIATLYLYDTPNATDAMRVYIHHCVRHGGEHKMQVLLSEPTMLQHLSGILPLEYHLHLQNSYTHINIPGNNLGTCLEYEVDKDVESASDEKKTWLTFFGAHKRNDAQYVNGLKKDLRSVANHTKPWPTVTALHGYRVRGGTMPAAGEEIDPGRLSTRMDVVAWGSHAESRERVQKVIQQAMASMEKPKAKCWWIQVDYTRERAKEKKKQKKNGQLQLQLQLVETVKRLTTHLTQWARKEGYKRLPMVCFRSGGGEAVDWTSDEMSCKEIARNIQQGDMIAVVCSPDDETLSSIMDEFSYTETDRSEVWYYNHATPQQSWWSLARQQPGDRGVCGIYTVYEPAEETEDTEKENDRVMKMHTAMQVQRVKDNKDNVRKADEGEVAPLTEGELAVENTFAYFSKQFKDNLSPDLSHTEEYLRHLRHQPAKWEFGEAFIQTLKNLQKISLDHKEWGLEMTKVMCDGKELKKLWYMSGIVRTMRDMLNGWSSVGLGSTFLESEAFKTALENSTAQKWTASGQLVGNQLMHGFAWVPAPAPAPAPPAPAPAPPAPWEGEWVEIGKIPWERETVSVLERKDWKQQWETYGEKLGHPSKIAPLLDADWIALDALYEEKDDEAAAADDEAAAAEAKEYAAAAAAAAAAYPPNLHQEDDEEEEEVEDDGWLEKDGEVDETDEMYATRMRNEDETMEPTTLEEDEHLKKLLQFEKRRKAAGLWTSYAPWTPWKLSLETLNGVFNEERGPTWDQWAYWAKIKQNDDGGIIPSCPHRLVIIETLDQHVSRHGKKKRGEEIKGHEESLIKAVEGELITLLLPLSKLHSPHFIQRLVANGVGKTPPFNREQIAQPYMLDISEIFVSSAGAEKYNEKVEQLVAKEYKRLQTVGR